MDLWNVDFMLAAFCGGLLAAALGPIAAFVMCGILGVIGCAAAMLGNVDFLNIIAFGPYFGPHISFAAAVAATSYAGKKQLLHGRTDLLVPLYKFKKWDVLLAGGAFGACSYFVNGLLTAAAAPVDTVAFTVVITNVAARLLFGKGRIGRENGKVNCRISTSLLAFHVLFGFAVGLLSAFGTQITGTVLIGYCIGATALIFLNFNDFPVMHHVALCAAYASVATGSLLIGGVFGALAMLCGEFIGNLFNTNLDTYIDPPAVVITLFSVVVFLLFP